MPTLIGPVIESKNNNNSFINEHPGEIFKKHRFNQVPIINGFNKNEGDLFAISTGLFYNFFSKTFFETQFEKYVTGMIGFKHHPKISQIANLLMKEYFGNITDFSDIKQTRTPLNTMIGDAMFVYPIVRFTKNHKYFGNDDTYLYRFSYNGKKSLMDGLDKNRETTTDKGPTHVDELQYLFDHGEYGKTPLEGNDLEIQKLLLTMWTNFAKKGNPTSNSSESVSLPNWKQATKNNTVYLEIGDDLNEMRSEYQPERMKLWNYIYTI